MNAKHYWKGKRLDCYTREGIWKNFEWGPVTVIVHAYGVKGVNLLDKFKV